MADDVQAKAEAFLSEVLVENSVDATIRSKLVTWMSAQVLQERQGWSKKIQMAFKEVEKERKLALDVHGRIHDINKKFEPHLFNLFLFREASIYHATEADSKVNHVDQLDKNLSALFDMINAYQEERIQCFQYLKIADNTMNLANVLRKRISRLEDQSKRTEDDSKEMEERLNKEVHNANEALDMQIKMNQEERDKNEKKTKEMQRTISDLRAQMSEENIHLLTPSRSSMSRNSKPVTPVFNVNRSVSNIRGAAAFTDAITQTSNPTRDCCIQVSLGAYIENKTKTPPPKEKLAMQSKSQEKINFAQDIDIADLKPLPLPGTTAYPIKQVTIIKKRNGHTNHKYQALDDVIAANSPANQKLADVSLSSFSDTEGSPRKNVFDKNAHHKTVRVVEFLRGQVTQLASKLERSKQEVDRYQQQLATMRQRAVNREGGFYRTKDEPSQSPNKGTPKPNSTSPSEGKLTGIKIASNDSSPSPRFSYTQQNGQRVITKFSKTNFLHGMAKCLRCNKVYKLSENNQHACRFHPKTRQQIEKYDSQGRLVKVSHQWQCCYQNGEAQGCQFGEHM